MCYLLRYSTGYIHLCNTRLVWAFVTCAFLLLISPCLLSQSFPFLHHVIEWFWGTKSLGTAATSGLLYKPQMIDEGDFGAIGGTKIGRGNRSTRRKPAPAPRCPPQIPHDQTRARTRAAAVGSQRLAAWAVARPYRMIHWVQFIRRCPTNNTQK
jgi:hypothetical protein